MLGTLWLYRHHKTSSPSSDRSPSFGAAGVEISPKGDGAHINLGPLPQNAFFAHSLEPLEVCISVPRDKRPTRVHTHSYTHTPAANDEGAHSLSDDSIFCSRKPAFNLRKVYRVEHKKEGNILTPCVVFREVCNWKRQFFPPLYLKTGFFPDGVYDHSGRKQFFLSVFLYRFEWDCIY